MKKKLLCLIIAALSVSIPAAAAEAAENKNYTAEQKNEYIEYVNKKTAENESSHVADICGDCSFNAEAVKNMIEAYKVPDKPYLDGREWSESDFSYAVQRRNVESICDPVNLEYGILVNNASLRAFPVWQKISDKPGSDGFDYLQETMLSAGDGVIILHTTSDGIWSFVQGSFYNGWIESDRIAKCTKEEMCEYLKSSEFCIVNQAQITVNDILLRMGNRFPLCEKTEDGFVILMPAKDENGCFITEETAVSKDNFNEGYLELTPENIAMQAQKMIGVQYGWGDSNFDMDCTSTIRAVYYCFGIVLPRNSSWMPSSALKVTDLRNMSQEEKESFIVNLTEGSILLTRGHAMLYIGGIPGNEMMIHNVTKYRLTPDGDNIEPMKCVTTPVRIFSTAGEPFMNLYQFAIEADWDNFLAEY